jgi:hypothetical protein
MTTLITGETWGGNVEAVRAYLLREAQQAFTDLRQNLDAARTELCASIDSVSDVQAQYTPASGEGEDAWGIAEVLRHIATIEPIMARRVRLLGNGESTEELPRRQPGYLADVDSRKISELRQMLERSYAERFQAGLECRSLTTADVRKISAGHGPPAERRAWPAGRAVYGRTTLSARIWSI